VFDKVNYVEEMVLKDSQKLYDLNLKNRNACGNRSSGRKTIT
jgi:hypothetical protein